MKTGKRGQPASPKGDGREFCRNGHERTPESTYKIPGRPRQCRICKLAADDRYREANREACRAAVAKSVKRRQEALAASTSTPQTRRRRG